MPNSQAHSKQSGRCDEAIHAEPLVEPCHINTKFVAITSNKVAAIMGIIDPGFSRSIVNYELATRVKSAVFVQGLLQFRKSLSNSS